MRSAKALISRAAGKKDMDATTDPVRKVPKIGKKAARA